MCVSSGCALTSHNGAIYAVRGGVGRGAESVGKWPFSCVKIVDEVWVTL